MDISDQVMKELIAGLTVTYWYFVIQKAQVTHMKESLVDAVTSFLAELQSEVRDSTKLLFLANNAWVSIPIPRRTSTLANHQHCQKH